MSKVIYTKNAPDAIGPYSQGIITGNLLFTSGQIAINPATGAVEAATIEEQTEQVCKNIGALLSREHFYFVPFRQDNPKGKPASVVADFALIPDTIKAALAGVQLQPVIRTLQ